MPLAFLFVVISVSLSVLTGCDRDDRPTTDQPAPTVGEQVKDAADKTGQTLDRAAQKTGDVLQSAADATSRAASKVATELQAATRPTTLPDGM
jgi:hypothetical protein